VAKQPSFLILVASVISAVVLIYFAPRWTEPIARQFDTVPTVQPTVGSLVTGETQTWLRHYGDKQPDEVRGDVELRHLDSLQLPETGAVEISLAGYKLSLTGPAHVVVERWIPNQADGPVLIHQLSGTMNVVSEGQPGRVYVLRGGEMTDPKGASVERPRVLHVSPVAVGEPPQSAPAAETGPAPLPNLVAPAGESDPDSLSNDYLDSQIAKHADQFQRCQSNALREKGEVKGDVLVGLTISPEGRMIEARVLSSTIQNDRLHGCIIQVFGRVKVKPFHGAPIVRSYPLSFE
jgi:hypothetical protein